MQDVHFRHNNLTAAEVRSGQLHRLHRVKLFSAAICHITQGSKVIIQDENRLVAGPGELIIIPANTPLEIINQPERGAFRSDLLLLSTHIITVFKNSWVEDFPPAKLTSLCTPMSNGLAFMWESLLGAVRQDLPAKLQEHQAMGLLLALLHDGVAGPLLIERRFNLTEQVRQLIMLSPAKLWTAQEIAGHLSIGTSTLRRRLQMESQSYRQIVEEVRMSCALSQLQSTTLPIGEIALRCGYLSGSRFTARFRQHYGCLPKQVR
ncbi:AraC family transcriptional regulator [Citrobacter portucalensis]|uniref:AraC family transcriptional regulator n=1 Tax=Citrobacter portucalensis TaxID=1639133 RepID=UPI000F44CE37|nr:AraC family transcriptional regulator [Citrobacter portucalensis]MBA8419125.1 AraC family transcriptional regulator [Citrobacter freundii]RNL69347.1 AraC family transcriptional regulator [Citrobacter sp. MH181794]MDE9612389.1 AraC family transcriptional regulator [Citrobacter portucalensis]QMM95770.1 AraC family transcriptional regulator [Citrobacter freundii]WFZ22783.1 AraC family transcriptional regulator [Citrobacter portucalensis]